MKTVRIRYEDERLCREVASLHINTIFLGLLPLLGKRFLTKMYRCIAVAPQSGVWAMVDGGKLVGFIAGCATVSKTYRWILLNHGLSLAIAAGWTLTKYSVLRKLYSLLFYPFRRRMPETKMRTVEAELLAIAIEESEHGKGYGRQLLFVFEDALSKWDVKEYRVLTNISELSSSAFYLSTGFTPAGTLAHHTLTLQIYEKAISVRTSGNGK